MKAAIGLVVALSSGFLEIAQTRVPTDDPLMSFEACSDHGHWQSGIVTQAEYRFRYDSAKGVNCRVYRLSNKPGQLSVRIKWKDTRDKSEILCETRLPE